MGSVLPSDRRELVQFALSHSPTWVDAAAGIGLDNETATLFKNATTAASAKLAAAEAARIASKAATTAYYGAVNDLRDIASRCVRDIKAFVAEAQPNPLAVYALAEIPAPEPRSGSGVPPAQPTNLAASVEPTGALKVTWKCANPPGVSRVVYVVQRKLQGETAFNLIGFTGEKSFVDNTLPIGVDGVTYIITGQAGGLAGPSSTQFAVTFGSVPGGAGGSGRSFVATASESPSVKLAA